MKRALLISNVWTDDSPLNGWFRDRDWELVCFDDPEKAFGELSTHRRDLILLDLNSWSLDFREVCQSLRKKPESRDTPIVALIDRKRIDRLDVTSGFDDFILLPSDPTEIEARVNLALWMRQGIDSDDVVKVDTLKINLAKYEVTINNDPVVLTLKEFELLAFLATHRGKVFSREFLLNRIWGYDYFGGLRTVDVHVRRIRAKLESSGIEFIETVRGAGYRFKE